MTRGQSRAVSTAGKEHVCWGTVALVALAVVTVVLVGQMLAASRDAAVTPPAGVPKSLPVTPEQQGDDKETVVVVMGDSYTSGSPMNEGSPTWPHVIASREGWLLFVDAAGATGYVNFEDLKQPFPQRAPADAADYEADLVILAGGLNDRGVPLPKLRSAATDTVRAVRTRLPHSDIVMLSPFGGPDPEPDVFGIGAALHQVADEQGINFLDVTGLLMGPNSKLVGRDGLHPIGEGHELLATKISAGLDRLRVPRADAYREPVRR